MKNYDQLVQEYGESAVDAARKIGWAIQELEKESTHDRTIFDQIANVDLRMFAIKCAKATANHGVYHERPEAWYELLLRQTDYKENPSLETAKVLSEAAAIAAKEWAVTDAELDGIMLPLIEHQVFGYEAILKAVNTIYSIESECDSEFEEPRYSSLYHRYHLKYAKINYQRGPSCQSATILADAVIRAEIEGVTGPEERGKVLDGLLAIPEQVMLTIQMSADPNSNFGKKVKLMEVEEEFNAKADSRTAFHLGKLAAEAGVLHLIEPLEKIRIMTKPLTSPDRKVRIAALKGALCEKSLEIIDPWRRHLAQKLLAEGVKPSRSYYIFTPPSAPIMAGELKDQIASLNAIGENAVA